MRICFIGLWLILLTAGRVPAGDKQPSPPLALPVTSAVSVRPVATFDFSRGFHTAAMTCNNGASVANGSLSLTSTDSDSQVRSAYHTAKLAVNKFVTRFRFTPAGIGSSRTAGFAFVIQNKAATARYTGPAQGSSGYGGSCGYGSGSSGDIGASVALCFPMGGEDYVYMKPVGTFKHQYLKHYVVKPEIGNFISGRSYDVTATYDGATLQWTLTDTVTGDSFFQHQAIDIPAAVGSAKAGSVSPAERASLARAGPWP